MGISTDSLFVRSGLQATRFAREMIQFINADGERQLAQEGLEP